MISTERLIAALAADGTPSGRLAPPATRTLGWLFASVPFLVMITLIMSPRPDLLAKFAEARFAIEQFAAFATALTAAVVALGSTVPGRHADLAAVPAAGAADDLGRLSRRRLPGALDQPGRTDAPARPDLSARHHDDQRGAGLDHAAPRRRGAPLLPRLTVAYGVLAATALGDFGLRFFHPQDSSLTILVWQFGTVMMYAAIAGAIGHRLFGWRTTPGARAHRPDSSN